MRITFQCSTTETLEYLRVVNSILRSNKEVEENVRAYNTLKSAIESVGERVDKLEESTRRNRVCR